jgi:hypothetical protein
VADPVVPDGPLDEGVASAAGRGSTRGVASGSQALRAMLIPTMKAAAVPAGLRRQDRSRAGFALLGWLGRNMALDDDVEQLRPIRTETVLHELDEAEHAGPAFNE